MSLETDWELNEEKEIFYSRALAIKAVASRKKTNYQKKWKTRQHAFSVTLKNVTDDTRPDKPLLLSENIHLLRRILNIFYNKVLLCETQTCIVNN